MGQLSYAITRSGWDTWQGTVVLNYSISYDAATNRSTVTFSQSSVNYPGRKGYGSSSANTITVRAGDNTGSSGSASFSTGGSSNPAGVTYYGTPSPVSITVQHSAGPGQKTVVFQASTTISVYPFSNSTNLYNVSGSGSDRVLCYTVPDASVIAACSSAVTTQESLALTMTRYDSAYYHKAMFQIGSTTLDSSSAFATTLSYTVPRSWFDAYPSSTSLSVTVSVQTYTSSACTTAVGSAVTATVTVTADAGMAPTINSGFAAAAAYNTGTAAASISGYVQGYSKARLTLTKSKLTMANNATVSSYAVLCQGSTTTVSSPGATATADTPTLTAASATAITVTVTDSRGRTASTTLTVTPMAYAAPTLTGVSVFRCGSGGAASEAGTYYSAKATAGCSSLDGKNSVTLTARHKTVAAASYGSATALTSGTAKVLGGSLGADTSYIVRLTATDSLGNAKTAEVTLPGRTWALKFRADGKGAAFGKAPQYSGALELPEDWTLRFGAETFLQRVYPVGSIYMSVSSTSPAELFGGTWERIQDRFLLAAGSGYAAGATGGEAEHTLTESEMPGHTHAVAMRNTGTEAAGFGLTKANSFEDRVFVTESIGSFSTSSSGGGSAHNNMPPYLAVYIWKRTA